MIIVVGSTVISQYSMNTSNVYASRSSPYDSGRDHGCDDAGRSESDKYINQPEKGPSFHTQEFMNGYYAGLNECSGGGGGFEQPSQPPSSQKGGIDWSAACQIAHTLLGLQTPCDELVTSNNELTDKGEQVLACYLGGALLPLVDPATAAELYALGKQICPS